MKIAGPMYLKPDLVPHHVEVFYDRKLRLYTILVRSGSGIQIGDAEYEPRRPLADATAKAHGLPAFLHTRNYRQRL